MFKYLLGISMFVLLTSTTLFSQERSGERKGPHRNIEQQMQIAFKNLELEERQSKVHFQQEMRELELDERRAEIERQHVKEVGGKCGKKGECKGKKMLAPLLLLIFIINILLSIWVYKDIRKRETASGVWIFVTLLGGLFGALVYAVVRLGDIRQEDKQA